VAGEVLHLGAKDDVDTGLVKTITLFDDRLFFLWLSKLKKGKRKIIANSGHMNLE
jgi:hypothetical protein